jgi:hypothetical protein
MRTTVGAAARLSVDDDVRGPRFVAYRETGIEAITEARLWGLWAKGETGVCGAPTPVHGDVGKRVSPRGGQISTEAPLAQPHGSHPEFLAFPLIKNQTVEKGA